MRLIDADAFLKRNEEYADCEFIHPKYQNTLREIVDDEPTIPAPRWHRVEEELPDIGKSVLVWDAGCCWLAAREDDEIWQGRRYWKNTDGEWDRIEKDMYWMTIEPPKED